MKFLFPFIIAAIIAAVSIPYGQTGTVPVRPAAPSPTPTPTPSPIPDWHLLNNDYHVFQTFNNCGPAALSMTLSYYGIARSQQELGLALRPYQNPAGNNDDKSVTLDELAQKAAEYGLIAYHRPAGTPQLIKRFIASGIPVITRTLLKNGEDIGHYRVVKGYDDPAGTFVQDDSLQGKNLQYRYEDFELLWQPFNYEYLVLVPPETDTAARNILGPAADRNVAWQNATRMTEDLLARNPQNAAARFNLSVALYHTGDFARSVREYEAVRDRLPWRTLWYQREPILAYHELGHDDEVLRITEDIVSNQNRAYSELYILRGEIFRKRGNTDAARAEFEKAVKYNENLSEAREALESLN